MNRKKKKTAMKKRMLIL